MKKIITLTTLALFTSLAIAAWDYSGPQDERIAPPRGAVGTTLGWFARHADVVAVADIIAETSPVEAPDELIPADLQHVLKPVKKEHLGTFTVRVVNAIYGCTNGQEIVLDKHTPKLRDSLDHWYDPNFEYYPTNHSRIVFTGTAMSKSRRQYTPKVWKQTPESEFIIASTNEVVLWHTTRQWWYDGYQDNLPYTHLTNLVHLTRRERNWTNYYHAVRDAIPTPASPRVWEDSFWDMMMLLRVGTQGQYEYIMNDPLFPAECQEMLQDYYVRIRRYGEDE